MWLWIRKHFNQNRFQIKAINKVKWESKCGWYECLQRRKRWLMKTQFLMSVSASIHSRGKLTTFNFCASFTRRIGYVHGLCLLCLGSWYQGHSEGKCKLSISYDNNNNNNNPDEATVRCEKGICILRLVFCLKKFCVLFDSLYFVSSFIKTFLEKYLFQIYFWRSTWLCFLEESYFSYIVVSYIKKHVVILVSLNRASPIKLAKNNTFLLTL